MPPTSFRAEQLRDRRPQSALRAVAPRRIGATMALSTTNTPSRRRRRGPLSSVEPEASARFRMSWNRGSALSGLVRVSATSAPRRSGPDPRWRNPSVPRQTPPCPAGTGNLASPPARIPRMCAMDLPAPCGRIGQATRPPWYAMWREIDARDDTATNPGPTGAGVAWAWSGLVPFAAWMSQADSRSCEPRTP
jgi:hypothetical protein